MGRRGGSMEMRVVSGMGQGGLLSRSSGAGVDNVVTGAATCGVWGHVPLCPAIYLYLTILWVIIKMFRFITRKMGRNHTKKC